MLIGHASTTFQLAYGDKLTPLPCASVPCFQLFSTFLRMSLMSAPSTSETLLSSSCKTFPVAKSNCCFYQRSSGKQFQCSPLMQDYKTSPRLLDICHVLKQQKQVEKSKGLSLDAYSPTQISRGLNIFIHKVA